MNRREFALRFLKSAAALIVAPAFNSPVSAQTTNAPAAPDIIPYGTDRLENTDHAKLEISIAQQLAARNLKPLEVYNLFPKKRNEGLAPPLIAYHGPNPLANILGHIGAAMTTLPVAVNNWGDEPETSVEPLSFNTTREGYASTTQIVGLSDPKGNLTTARNFMNDHFRDQPKCKKLVLDPLAFGAFTALHEPIHNIILNMKDPKNGNNNPADLIFNTINNLPATTCTNTYICELSVAHKHDPANAACAAKFSGAMQCLTQIHERLADAGTALYTLANYTDKKAARDFFENLAAFRMARYNDEVHHTASSIQNALNAFSAEPREKLSIVTAAEWAIKIVQSQSDLQSYMVDKSSSEPQRQIAASVIDARNHICAIDAPRP